jgi:uncharacterized protein
VLADTKALQVTVYVHETNVNAVLDYLHEHEIAGATAFRAFAGFGMHHRMHTSRLVEEHSTDFPAVVCFCDVPARVNPVLPELSALAHGGLIAIHEVNLYRP